jgi:hypothetical protein
VLHNLSKFVEALNRDVKPQQIKAGFIHREGHGVLAIDRREEEEV